MAGLLPPFLPYGFCLDSACLFHSLPWCRPTALLSWQLSQPPRSPCLQSASEIISKARSDHVSSLLQNLQWLPKAKGEKSGSYQDIQMGHCGPLCWYFSYHLSSWAHFLFLRHSSELQIFLRKVNRSPFYFCWFQSVEYLRMKQ